MAGQENSKLIAVNRKARHDYFVMEAMEAGVELVGTEVKSIRTGAVNLKDSWVEIDGGELYVLGMHISPYEKGNIFNRDPVRKRKLLVHKREIKHLQEQQKLQGYTLIPLQLYFKRGKVKLELGVCKGNQMRQLSRAEAEGFYAVHKERPFFNDLVNFMTSGPVMIQVLEGEDAIAKNRQLMGATDPKKSLALR